MLNIQSVGIKKYKGEPALFTKPSLLICSSLETVIKLGRMRTSKLSDPSVEHSVTADRKRACSRDETGFTSFLSMTLQERPSPQDTGYFVNSAST